MDDLISRQAAIDAIESAFDRETILNRFVRKIAISAVRLLPSAQPEQRWIPCSERLPKKSGKYWCTFGGTYHTGIDSYTTKEYAEEIYEEPEEYVGWASQNVIAWMPLPEPWNGEQNGENDHVENPYPCKECMEQESHVYRDEHGDLVYRCYDCPLRQGDWWDN